MMWCVEKLVSLQALTLTQLVWLWFWRLWTFSAPVGWLKLVRTMICPPDRNSEWSHHWFRWAKNELLFIPCGSEGSWRYHWKHHCFIYFCSSIFTLNLQMINHHKFKNHPKRRPWPVFFRWSYAVQRSELRRWAPA